MPLEIHTNTIIVTATAVTATVIVCFIIIWVVTICD